jgi:basic membrane protein A and related proteins
VKLSRLLGIALTAVIVLGACSGASSTAAPVQTPAPVPATAVTVPTTAPTAVPVATPAAATVAASLAASSEPSSAATPASSAAVDASKLTGAALLLTQKRGDRGVVDALVEGFLNGTSQLGYQKKQVVELTDPATYEQTVGQVAASGVSIIVATFPPMIDAIKAVAPQYPNVNFVIVDAQLGQTFPNVQELFFFENESSYLAGIAAGLMTKSNRIGFIGGDDVDVINRYLVGYYEGAHASNPNVKVCWTYAKSFEDPAKGKELALSMISDGADVLHAATAGTQLGIYEATESKGIPLISADVDVRPLAPKTGLFSTGPRFDQAVVLPLEQNATDSFKAGFQQYGLASGLVGATGFSALVPLDVATKVKEAEAAIAAGTIKVDDDKKLKDFSNCS